MVWKEEREKQMGRKEVGYSFPSELGCCQHLAMKEYLAYFASRNHEFRVPELESIAKCLGYEFRAEKPLVDGAFRVRS